MNVGWCFFFIIIFCSCFESLFILAPALLCFERSHGCPSSVEGCRLWLCGQAALWLVRERRGLLGPQGGGVARTIRWLGRATGAQQIATTMRPLVSSTMYICCTFTRQFHHHVCVVFLVWRLVKFDTLTKGLIIWVSSTWWFLNLYKINQCWSISFPKYRVVFF